MYLHIPVCVIPATYNTNVPKSGIYVRRGRVPFFSLPFIALFVVVAVCLFAFFGVLALVALGVLGAGASVLRKLFPGKDRKTGPRVDGPGGDTITLGEDDYEVRDVD